MSGPRYTDADFTPDQLAELIVITEWLRINMPEDIDTDPAQSDRKEEH